MLQSLETGQTELLNQIPDITIKNGRASIDQNQPYYIRRSNGTPLAILDTTGSMNYIDDANVLFLLTEDNLIVRRSTTAFNTFDLAGITDLHINKQIVNGWVKATKSAIAPLSYGLFLMLSYIFAVLVLLLVASLGLILSAALHNSLHFAGALRIAIVAATPAIIFITISASLNYAIPSWAYLGITLLYLFIGIKSCGKVSDTDDENSIDLKSFLHEEDATVKEAA